MQICPFCKNNIPGNAKKCLKCGRTLPAKKHARISFAKTISMVVATLIMIIAVICVINYNTSEEIQEKNTLKDSYGTELSPDDIVVKFNSFMQNAESDSLSIEELVLEAGVAEDIYRDVKNNEDISISITTRKEDKAATSVLILASVEGLTDFITYCFALMNILNPVMNANIRQKVLFDMLGYEENGNKPLNDKNTYIIGETKYIFTNLEHKGLSMLIEEMPELEIIYEGVEGVPPSL